VPAISKVLWIPIAISGVVSVDARDKDLLPRTNISPYEPAARARTDKAASARRRAGVIVYFRGSASAIVLAAFVGLNSVAGTLKRVVTKYLTPAAAAIVNIHAVRRLVVRKGIVLYEECLA